MVRPFEGQDVSCKDVLDYICEQFGDEEDSERCQEVKRHLDKCSNCSTYCNSLETMIGLYRVAAPDFSEDAKDFLLQSIGLKDPPKSETT
ncbi:MAG: hypothetical protein CL946_00630 [Ectothiorhodospiraceae bacterium]|nr:hypothetical protein [Ectothiorhodospiraceae bacterium]